MKLRLKGLLEEPSRSFSAFARPLGFVACVTSRITRGCVRVDEGMPQKCILDTAWSSWHVALRLYLTSYLHPSWLDVADVLTA